VLGLRVGEKHPRVIWAVGYRWASKTVQGNTYTRLAKTQGSSNLYGAKLCSFQGRFPRPLSGCDYGSVWQALASVGATVCHPRRWREIPRRRSSRIGKPQADGRDRLTRSRDRPSACAARSRRC